MKPPNPAQAEIVHRTRFANSAQYLRFVLRSTRPLQWVKNVFVLGPLLFSDSLTRTGAVARSLACFGLFSLISGAVYLLNDVVDREKDVLHPKKRYRPIASGSVSVSVGLFLSATLTILALVLASLLEPTLALVLLAYAIVNLAYSFRLKHVVIIDAFCVASGFVFRVLGGALVLQILPSEWLLLCTLMLSLFIAFAKRKHELILLEAGAGEHRAILRQYGSGLLDQLLTMSATATFISYALYTFFSKVGRTHPSLMLSIPFTLYGLYRYLYLIHQVNEGGSPEELVFADRPLLGAIAGWVLTVTTILYLI